MLCQEQPCDDDDDGDVPSTKPSGKGKGSRLQQPLPFDVKTFSDACVVPPENDPGSASSCFHHAGTTVFADRSPAPVSGVIYHFIGDVKAEFADPDDEPDVFDAFAARDILLPDTVAEVQAHWPDEPAATLVGTHVLDREWVRGAPRLSVCSAGTQHDANDEFADDLLNSEASLLPDIDAEAQAHRPDEPAAVVVGTYVLAREWVYGALRLGVCSAGTQTEATFCNLVVLGVSMPSLSDADPVQAKMGEATTQTLVSLGSHAMLPAGDLKQLFPDIASDLLDGPTLQTNQLATDIPKAFASTVDVDVEESFLTDSSLTDSAEPWDVQEDVEVEEPLLTDSDVAESFLTYSDEPCDVQTNQLAIVFPQAIVSTEMQREATLIQKAFDSLEDVDVVALHEIALSWLKWVNSYQERGCCEEVYLEIDAIANILGRRIKRRSRQRRRRALR